MSFATVKANLEKEGASLLYKLKDELREELDVFRSRTSESYNEIIIQMQRDLIIAESVALHEQLGREGKPVVDTSLWYDRYNNYLELMNKYSNHFDKFVDREYIKDFRDELKDVETSLVETAPSGSVRPDLKSIVRIFEGIHINMEFDEDLHFDVERFVKRYKMYQDIISGHS